MLSHVNELRTRICRIALVKIQKQTKGNYTVTISPALMAHCGWSQGAVVNLCPCESGLRIVALKNAKVQV